jgi:hypothetical protein
MLPTLNKTMLLSFHDISVENFERLTPIIKELEEFTGKAFALLIIPDTSNASKIQIEKFINQLKVWEAASYELLLHGYTHQISAANKKSWKARFSHYLTNGEAEFSALPAKESAEKLKKSIEAWRNLGLKSPKVFVPPAWYGSTALKKQVLSLNMTYESRFFIKSNSFKFFSFPISFAGLPVLFSKLIFSFSMFLIRSPIRNIRIALHPSDFPLFRSSIWNLIGHSKKRRAFKSYLDWYKDNTF